MSTWTPSPYLTPIMWFSNSFSRSRVLCISWHIDVMMSSAKRMCYKSSYPCHSILSQCYLLQMFTMNSFKIPKGLIRIRKSKKDWQTMAKWKMTKGQAMISKTLHRKLKIEQCKWELLKELLNHMIGVKYGEGVHVDIFQNSWFLWFLFHFYLDFKVTVCTVFF
jgi:hypothetical protein